TKSPGVQNIPAAPTNVNVQTLGLQEVINHCGGLATNELKSIANLFASGDAKKISDYWNALHTKMSSCDPGWTEALAKYFEYYRLSHGSIPYQYFERTKSCRKRPPAQLLALVISQVTTPETFEFDAVDDVVADVASGKIVIVTDDADRENEGDLVMAAEKATAASVNFMAMHGRGLICVPISNERAEQLGLKRMVAENRERYSTDFTVSVYAADG